MSKILLILTCLVSLNSLAADFTIEVANPAKAVILDGSSVPTTASLVIPFQSVPSWITGSSKNGIGDYCISLLETSKQPICHCTILHNENSNKSCKLSALYPGTVCTRTVDQQNNPQDLERVISCSFY